jgi:hypothetical protein
MKIVEREIRKLRIELFVSILATLVAMACLVYIY